MSLPKIQLSDYTYSLPQDRIAQYPLEDRAASKLLIYDSGEISHQQFRQLKDLLPPKSHLVFNNTKVIPARLYFERATGAQIEIFLLSPTAPSTEVASAMQATGTCTWSCIIGNLKRWKGEPLLRQLTLDGNTFTLEAHLIDRERRLVEFRWNEPDLQTADWMEAAGQLPLPPYLQREATEEDKPRYQTVYSQESGAVAAPTAGLHFTKEILAGLTEKGHTTDFLTLHVGAGTFQPIKAENILEHSMHREQLVIYRENIEKLLANQGPVIAVGTTSLRTLESTFWFGASLISDPDHPFQIAKLAPYEKDSSTIPTKQAALGALLAKMDRMGVNSLVGETEIFCFPGYKFQVVEGLVTNFHLPESTLILLIAAFIGEDWRKVYSEALATQYRFLSYGDSSLLLPGNAVI